MGDLIEELIVLVYEQEHEQNQTYDEGADLSWTYASRRRRKDRIAAIKEQINATLGGVK